ncbi:hypothetical protein [Lacticaseibacillus nasuensis]|uniref:Uncharacterized protein n=1 Tax=Lacticaseibacillus nasuensis JCM 17158 TaxID=1291734 RepID=A0A0R1JI54_9LACO|nr:hypothetical protein [Lacticaseibacillus nasuensis]KRK70982.1 hypothetical protein FD02_GL000164 [Lacticaseibacillus nasuensis JCM 17158]MCX2455740.1 hypothetical protein [Lacticaseibacillus nasuensis]
MKPTEDVTREQKIEGADAIMDKGYITEHDEPAMMDKAWCAPFLEQINDELRLRTVAARAKLQLFHYYSGDGVIIYDPKQLTEADAKRNLRQALGYHK